MGNFICNNIVYSELDNIKNNDKFKSKLECIILIIKNHIDNLLTNERLINSDLKNRQLKIEVIDLLLNMKLSLIKININIDKIVEFNSNKYAFYNLSQYINREVHKMKEYIFILAISYSEESFIEDSVVRLRRVIEILNCNIEDFIIVTKKITNQSSRKNSSKCN